MQSISLTRCVAAALLVGAVACARNKEQETGRAAGPDTAAMTDTTGHVQNPPGYRGIETDTTMLPRGQEQPVDTFLQNQGVNPRADTSGYHGVERIDTTGMRQRQVDTAQVVEPDTSAYRSDTTGYRPDTSGMRSDTTGMPPDTTSGR